MNIVADNEPWLVVGMEQVPESSQREPMTVAAPHLVDVCPSSRDLVLTAALLQKWTTATEHSMRL